MTIRYIKRSEDLALKRYQRAKKHLLSKRALG